ncbi:unnamed protein product [Mucor hiemalis]
MSSNIRQGTRLLNNNESISTHSRKRPAASISSINTSSTNKRPQSHRMSLALDRLQLNSKYTESIGPQRHSFIEPGYAIESRQQPLLNVVPRSSVFSSRRASSIVRNPNASSPAQRIIDKFNIHDKTPPRRTATDMRLLKDPTTQRKHLKAIVEYLNESHYAGVPAPKNIRFLSGKDFQSMFKFFVERLVPNHAYNKKFEDEAMDIIRDLQYPLIDTISPKDFLAIGALHSLPAFYALLYWLMLRCKVEDQFLHSQKRDSTEMIPLIQSIYSGRVFQSFCVESYKAVFYENKADLNPQMKDLKDKFDQADTELASMIGQLEIKKNSLQLKHDALIRSKSSLQDLQTKLEIVTSDKAKFIKASEDKRARIEKYKDQNARVQKEIDRMATTRELMKAERNEILANWEARGTSLEEIEKVEGLYRQVNAEYTEESTKYGELMRSIHELEVRSAKAKTEIQSLIQEYNNKIAMIPKATEDMRITYNEHGMDIHDVLNVDVENYIIPRLDEYEKELRKGSVQLTEITLRQREELNDKRMRIEEKSVDLRTVEVKVAKLKEEYEELHAVNFYCYF